MHIVFKLSAHYDWEPVPPGTEITKRDQNALRVKPAANGTWLMRVKKTRETETQVTLPEQQLINYLIGEARPIRGERVLTRKEGVAEYLSRLVMAHHAHRNWMTGVEVHDSGPEPELFEKILGEHVAEGTVSEETAEELREAYAEAHDDSEHADHLSKHFRVKETG